MPFLRVLRDKRGYETTYLMHWFREGPRQRSRVLYVFRTPGGARVGRTPLEPDVVRHLELHYPEIAFDWPSVRENQQVIEAAPDMRPRRPRREEAEIAPRPPAPQPEPPRADPPRPTLPASLEGATPDEQIAFLMQWYPVFRDRVALKTADPSRREALSMLVERLNPAAWTDADQITMGLPQAADALDRLSRVLARRRRRGRKRVEAPGAEPSETPEGNDSDPAAPD